MDVGINQAWLAPPSGVETGANYGHDFVQYQESNRRFTRRDNFLESVVESFEKARRCNVSTIGFWAFEGQEFPEGIIRNSGFRLAPLMQECFANIVAQAIRFNISIKWTLLAPNRDQSIYTRIIGDRSSYSPFYQNCVRPFLNTILRGNIDAIDGRESSLPELVYYIDLINEVNFCVDSYHLFTTEQARAFIRFIGTSIRRDFPNVRLAVSVAGENQDWQTWLHQQHYIYFLDLHKYNNEGRVPEKRELVRSEITVTKPVILGEFGQSNQDIISQGGHDDNIHSRVVERFLNEAKQKRYHAAFAWRLITHSDQRGDISHGHAFFGYFYNRQAYQQSLPPSQRHTTQGPAAPTGRFLHRPRLAVGRISEWVVRNRM